eukprot:5138211-Pleurochrysis_carterae.AAC.1
MSRALSYRLMNGATCVRSRRRWRRQSTGLSGCASGRHQQSRYAQDGRPPALGQPMSAELGLLST